jgi:hypothetical protein
MFTILERIMTKGKKKKKKKELLGIASWIGKVFLLVLQESSKKERHIAKKSLEQRYLVVLFFFSFSLSYLSSSFRTSSFSTFGVIDSI